MELIVAAGIILVLALVLAAMSYKLNLLEHRLAAWQQKPKPLAVTEPTAADLDARLKAAYETEIATSAKTFGSDLAATSTRLSEQVSRLTTQVIEEELGAYQSTLEELRKTATETMEQIRANVEKQRVELRASMEAEVAADRSRLIEKFETRMGDIVAAYLNEALGGGVDLGAQMSYIVSSLETHKADIKKDLSDGV